MADSPIRVLVADDYHESADMLGQLLRISGCEVITVHSGQQAIDAAKPFQPQVVIVDVHMPGMDGFDTIAAFMSVDDCSRVIGALQPRLGKM
jgi:two-component system OmpR family response regulator